MQSALSRWAAVLHAAAAPPARADGLGARFNVGVAVLAFASASVVAIAPGVALLAEEGPLSATVAVAVALAAGLLSARAARRAVGGRTGDTIGATVAVAEVAVALVLLGFWR